jgi:hypothetical protein
MSVEGIIVVLIASVLGPVVLSWFNNRQAIAREERANKRQDALDARMKENNLKLVALQRSADEIHILVNSNLTAQMVAELDATERELVALREIIELKRAAGVTPTDAAEKTITFTVAKIAELRFSLSRRLAQQEILDGMVRK